MKLVQGWFEVMGFEMMTAGIVVACATVTGTRAMTELLNSGDASALPIIVVGGGTLCHRGRPSKCIHSCKFTVGPLIKIGRASCRERVLLMV